MKKLLLCILGFLSVGLYAQEKETIYITYDEKLDSIDYVNKKITYFYIQKPSYNQEKKRYDKQLKKWKKKYAGTIIAGIDEEPIPPEKYFEFSVPEEGKKLENKITFTRKQLTKLEQKDFINYDVFVSYKGKLYNVFLIPVFYE